MNDRYVSPFCPKGCNEVESQTHKYATCEGIVNVWNYVRERVELLEPELIFETDYSFI